MMCCWGLFWPKKSLEKPNVIISVEENCGFPVGMRFSMHFHEESVIDDCIFGCLLHWIHFFVVILFLCGLSSDLPLKCYFIYVLEKIKCAMGLQMI
jgi:hypothetical protein